VIRPGLLPEIVHQVVSTVRRGERRDAP
jgi:hypothetical protein